MWQDMHGDDFEGRTEYHPLQDEAHRSIKETGVHMKGHSGLTAVTTRTASSMVSILVTSRSTGTRLLR